MTTGIIEKTPREEPVDSAAEKEAVEAALASAIDLLAPLERACILLKDVFDYSLKEAAEITGTTPGSVKSALHRGRTKLKNRPVDVGGGRRRQPDEQLAELLRRYVDLFNARDVEGLKTLVAQDARLEVVGIFEGGGNEIADRYFTNYGRLPGARKLALGSVDGELVVLGMSNESGRYIPVSAARVHIRDGQIGLVRDYLHVDYLLDAAESVRVE